MMIVLHVRPLFHLQRGITTHKLTPCAHTTSPHHATSFCEQGRLKEAFHILHMTDNPVDSCTYVSLLQACIQTKALVEGKLIHAHMNQRGVMADTLLHNTLINMYVKCGNVADARIVFNEMPHRNVCSWTVMIAAYGRYGLPEEALALFHQMQQTGVQPNQFTFSSVLRACAKLASLEQAVGAHKEIIRNGLDSNVFVATALVDMYAKCGKIETARKVFDEISKRDVVTWTTMIAGYAQNGLIDDAMDLFKQMPQRNVVSWTAMVAGFAQNGLIHEAEKLFKVMPKRTVVSWNAMITGYAQNGLVDEAMRVFNEMPQRDVVSWNAMMAGFAQNGHGEEALRLFQDMQFAGLRPDINTFATILPVCANLASLEQGEEIHEQIMKNGFQSDVVIMNALIDMYAKCGSLQKAQKLFDKMHGKNVISWTAMIAGYALNGCGKEALKLFEQMKYFGINPDNITLFSVLSACSHAGLVDEGYKYFNSMKESYQITPGMEHYRCMVDLLGRAGRLHKAEDFISKMPLKPDASLWNCLLSACRKHNNMELGQSVAKRVLDLDPTNAAPYLLLLNIYSAGDRWDEMEKLRRMMKDRVVKKTPGCSWIEVNKQVHTFLVRDRSHSQAQTIYAKLEKLSNNLCKVGEIVKGDDSCMAYS